jgi:hypothetical protein
MGAPGKLPLEAPMPIDTLADLFRAHLAYGVAECELEKLKPGDPGRPAATATLARARERYARAVLAHGKAVAAQRQQ